MLINNYRNIPSSEEAPGVDMRVLIGPLEGAPNFIMRLFEVKPFSSTPYHSHSWEHEVFVLGGKGTVRSVASEQKLREGDSVLVAPNEQHCFTNTSDEPFRFICVIPLIKE